MRRPLHGNAAVTTSPIKAIAAFTTKWHRGAWDIIASRQIPIRIDTPVNHGRGGCVPPASRKLLGVRPKIGLAPPSMKRSADQTDRRRHNFTQKIKQKRRLSSALLHLLGGRRNVGLIGIYVNALMWGYPPALEFSFSLLCSYRRDKFKSFISLRRK